MTLYRQLLARENENNPIRVGVIGAGQMGVRYDFANRRYSRYECRWY